ncbi:RRM domain-containing protein [Coprinopsis cinerea AmutBmut pab1-1]|nr:RRM domain-containing protein [Coprinopsis cinerea AmutBmut pab1-1]
MIFDPASAPHLKPWLVRTLEPICDAEPGALADYILALLKHNVPEPEMRKELQVQLEEFLENECKSFIDTLFTVLRTKSYLPYSTNPPSPPPANDEGKSTPLDGTTTSGAAGPSSDRTRKRSFGDDERDTRPSKGPRLSADGDFSRYGNGRADQQWGTGRQGMGQEGAAYGGQMNGRRQGYQPPGQKRGICRDYHNHGFCARGETCKYSHGDDAVIPSQLYPMVPPMMPFNYLYNMFNAQQPYDPNDARIDGHAGGPRQHQRAPIMPREGGAHPHASGELPVIQDLTPSAPTDPNAPQKPPMPQQPSMANMPIPPQLMAMMPGIDPSMFAAGMPPFAGPPMDPSGNMPPGSDATAPQGPPSNQTNPNFRGRGGPSNRGRGGSFGVDASSFRPNRRGDKTLVVEKIPEDKLSLDSITSWFKKFGEVTNVAVDPRGGKALVSFATHEEARAAWKSEDAVFNNRFVKVFWHKPMEGHGQVGQRALAASASLVANLNAKETGGTQAGSSSSTASQAGASASASPVPAAAPKKSTQSSAAAALAAKQELLEKQIAEQKALMNELTGATAERKKEIMARLRKLNEEMTTAKDTPTPPPPSKKPTPESTDATGQDKDTEMQPPEGEATGEETTEQLKAKLERLKAEAASLGIESADASGGYSGYRGGYRGRGRGRGFYRGGPAMRGGPPRGSLKLDNRPKKLLVKGANGESEVQHVKDWYESLGQVENIETLDGGDVLVSFRTRAAAEQGLAKGTSIPGIPNKLTITWHVSKNPTPSTTAVPSSSKPTGDATGSSTSMTVDKDPGAEEDGNRSPPRHEEEEVGGWGGYDDGMGML